MPKHVQKNKSYIYANLCSGCPLGWIHWLLFFVRQRIQKDHWHAKSKCPQYWQGVFCIFDMSAVGLPLESYVMMCGILCTRMPHNSILNVLFLYCCRYVGSFYHHWGQFSSVLVVTNHFSNGQVFGTTEPIVIDLEDSISGWGEGDVMPLKWWWFYSCVFLCFKKRIKQIGKYWKGTTFWDFPGTSKCLLP